MTYLLDTNLLIALVDQEHVHHGRAHRWATAQSSLRWATCPIVENAFVRITSNPSYPNPYPSASDALAALRDNCDSPHHTFWPGDFSVRDETIWAGRELLSGTHLTDLYLLALAARQGGKLASFDSRIPHHFIRHGRESLLVIPA